MKKTLFAIILTLLMFTGLMCTPPAPVEKVTTFYPDANRAHEIVTWEVHFSPKGGCTARIVQEIGNAKLSVHMLAYTFTSPSIAAALVAARARGDVDIEVIVDRSDVGDAASQNTQVPALRRGHVPVWEDAKHVIAHNKILVIDGQEIETGSFNYTQEAENGNAENCLLVIDKNLAGLYEANFELHKSHSILLP